MEFENQMQFILDSIEWMDTKPTSAWIKKDVNPNAPVNNPNSEDHYSRYAGDIYALVNEFGVLYRTQTISVTLQKMLQIAPRNRRRIESYQGLISYLRDEVGVTLTIVSNKTKNKENE